MANKELEMYFKRVSFNDDFDCVADMNTEPIYLKLVRNIVEISDEQGLTTKELTQKPTGKGQTVKELEREVERLKGLIEVAFKSDGSWSKFKTENSL